MDAAFGRANFLEWGNTHLLGFRMLNEGLLAMVVGLQVPHPLE